MDVEKLLEGLDVDIWGVADVAEIEHTFHESVERGKYRRALIIGVRLLNDVLETIRDRPTLLYKHHYKTVNWILDQTAFRIASRIRKAGYRALPIAASQEVDWERQLGHLSHKLVGYTAGIGWIGKSGLLIHPLHGPRVRYATILTDMPIEVTGQPLESQCGACTACIDACPAGALSEEGYDMERCLKKLREFAAIRGIGQLICGICIQACPIGR